MMYKYKLEIQIIIIIIIVIIIIFHDIYKLKFKKKRTIKTYLQFISIKNYFQALLIIIVIIIIIIIIITTINFIKISS